MAVSGRPETDNALVRFSWAVAGTGAFLLALSQLAYLAPELWVSRPPALDLRGSVHSMGGLPRSDPARRPGLLARPTGAARACVLWRMPPVRWAG